MKPLILTLMLGSSIAYGTEVDVYVNDAMGDCYGAEITTLPAPGGGVDLVADFGEVRAFASDYDQDHAYKRCLISYDIELPYDAVLDRMEFFADGTYNLKGNAEASFSVTNRPLGAKAVSDTRYVYGRGDFSESLGAIYREDLPARSRNPGATIAMTTRASVEVYPGDDGQMSYANFKGLGATPTAAALPSHPTHVRICRIYFK